MRVMRLAELVKAATEHLRAVIAECFPRYTEINQVSDQEDFMLRVSYSPRDSDRLLTIIELTIARESVEAYSEASKAAQRLADVRLANAIRDKLTLFDQEPHGEIASWLLGGLTQR